MERERGTPFRPLVDHAGRESVLTFRCLAFRCLLISRSFPIRLQSPGRIVGSRYTAAQVTDHFQSQSPHLAGKAAEHFDSEKDYFQVLPRSIQRETYMSPTCAAARTV